MIQAMRVSGLFCGATPGKDQKQNLDFNKVSLVFEDGKKHAFKCFGSGDAYSTTFNQHNISCVAENLGVGFHSLTVKHRSQYCVYGNYWQPTYSTMRGLSVKIFYTEHM